MAVPKRRMSRSNTRHRRSQWKAKLLFRSGQTVLICRDPYESSQWDLPKTLSPSGRQLPQPARILAGIA